MARDKLKFTEDQIRQAKSMDLMALAHSYGYQIKESEDRRMYKAVKGGGLYFYKDCNMYIHFGGEGKKRDAINFVMEHENLSFVDAVKRMLGPSYEPVRTTPPRVYTEPAVEERKPLVLPMKEGSFRRAYAYLVECRGISPHIVEAMRDQGRLYQGSYYNMDTGRYESVCVFLGFDEKGEAKYCSVRGTDPDSTIKEDKVGSNKEYPFYIPGRSNKLYVIEAPIDAMSHSTLAGIYGLDWQEDHRITTGCLSDKALKWFLQHHPEIKHVCWGYDNDGDGRKPVAATREEYETAEKAGDTSAFVETPTGYRKYIPWNWGQEAAEKYAHQYRKLGYTVGIQTPDTKDFNTDLVALRQMMARNRESEQPTEEEDYALEA